MGIYKDVPLDRSREWSGPAGSRWASSSAVRYRARRCRTKGRSAPPAGWRRVRMRETSSWSKLHLHSRKRGPPGYYGKGNGPVRGRGGAVGASGVLISALVRVASCAPGRLPRSPACGYTLLSLMRGGEGCLGGGGGGGVGGVGGGGARPPNGYAGPDRATQPRRAVERDRADRRERGRRPATARREAGAPTPGQAIIDDLLESTSPRTGRRKPATATTPDSRNKPGSSTDR